MNTDDLYRILRTGHAQAQGIVDTIADPLLVLDQALCVQAASRSFFAKFRVDRFDTIGKMVFDLGNGQWDIPELRRLLSEVVPKAVAIVNFEVQHDFPHLGHRAMLLTARKLYQPDGGGHSILLVIVDVTEQQARGAAQDLLFGELRHRMKNLLGVIQALARQTTTEGRTAEQYRDDLIGRLSALIAAENHAFDEQQSTDLKELIEHLLAPYCTEMKAVTIDAGHAVELMPRQVTALSMVLHELATNAAKYGALSVGDGRVRIGWRLNDGGDNLTITWSESGGPLVTQPSAKGFGTRLIQTTVEYGLRGQLDLDYAEDGLHSKIVIPLGSGAPRD